MRDAAESNDLGHARAVDEPIADWLNANGAEADFIYLGDLGITGNGHMLMLERNSDALADSRQTLILHRRARRDRKDPSRTGICQK